MSEKRFANLEVMKNLICLDDNDKFIVFTEKTLCNLLNELNDENEQLRRLFEEMKQSITINLTEEDEKELRKLLGLIDDE